MRYIDKDGKEIDVVTKEEAEQAMKYQINKPSGMPLKTRLRNLLITAIFVCGGLFLMTKVLWLGIICFVLAIPFAIAVVSK